MNALAIADTAGQQESIPFRLHVQGANQESGTNRNEILLARNRVKLQHKTYLYEGMKNIILAKCFTVSEFMFGCTLMEIEKMNNTRLEFVTVKDRLILRDLRRAITTLK